MLNDFLRLDGEVKIILKEMLNMKKENKIVNGYVFLGINEVCLEVCERIDGLNCLVLSFKLFVLKIFWKSRRGLFIKFFDFFLKVYILVWVFLVDFYVFVVIYMCSILNDYFRIDIDD